MTPPKRPCTICGKECEPRQRNQDGTYTHDDCSRAVTARMGWDIPGRLLASREPNEEE